jgi:hypothetical protein
MVKPIVLERRPHLEEFDGDAGVADMIDDFH